MLVVEGMLQALLYLVNKFLLKDISEATQEMPQ